MLITLRTYKYKKRKKFISDVTAKVERIKAGIDDIDL